MKILRCQNKFHVSFPDKRRVSPNQRPLGGWTGSFVQTEWRYLTFFCDWSLRIESIKISMAPISDTGFIQMKRNIVSIFYFHIETLHVSGLTSFLCTSASVHDYSSNNFTCWMLIFQRLINSNARMLKNVDAEIIFGSVAFRTVIYISWGFIKNDRTKSCSVSLVGALIFKAANLHEFLWPNSDPSVTRKIIQTYF